MRAKGKLLLIDDSHDILDMLELFLFKDFELTISMDGFEAVKLAENQHPDLILTDIMMPVMDGIKFFNTLRRKQSTRYIPVVALTTFNEEITTKSLLNMGFKDVVTKPFSRKRILKSVNDHILPLEEEG